MPKLAEIASYPGNPPAYASIMVFDGMFLSVPNRFTSKGRPGYENHHPSRRGRRCNPANGSLWWQINQERVGADCVLLGLVAFLDESYKKKSMSCESYNKKSTVVRSRGLAVEFVAMTRFVGPVLAPICCGIRGNDAILKLAELINVCIEHPHERSLELQVSEIQHPPRLKPIFLVATGRELR